MNRPHLLSLPLFAALALAAPTSPAAPPDEAQLARGKAAYNTCAACHGADGKGNRTLGAPNLTDAIWLYGGDRAALTQTVANARAGVMPGWKDRLDPATLNMLAAYVHSLGGGE